MRFVIAYLLRIFLYTFQTLLQLSFLRQKNLKRLLPNPGLRQTWIPSGRRRCHAVSHISNDRQTDTHTYLYSINIAREIF